MYSFLALLLIFGASALNIPRTQCTFGLTASGGQSGTIGQLDDGQNRIGGGLTAVVFSINNNGSVMDSAGRGCILTPSVQQFQCDQGSASTAGFSITSNGSFTSGGSSVFYACPASDTEYNLYTIPVTGQQKCVEISLAASGCGSTSSSSETAAPNESMTTIATFPIAETQPAEAGVSTVTVYNCASFTTPVTVFPQSEPMTQTQQAAVTGLESATESSTEVETPNATDNTTPGATEIESQTAGNTPVTKTSTRPATKTVTQQIQTNTAASTLVDSPTTFETSVETNPAATLTTSVATPAGSSTSSSVSSASTCEVTTLTGTYTDGNYQYPHLIIPVSSSTPSTAAGTQLFATISSNTSTILNFDIPSSDASKTCNLIFLLPEHDQLETSSYTSSGSGSIDFKKLSSVATAETTYNNQPSVEEDLGDFTITSGSSTLIQSFSCPAGEAISIELSANDDTYLYYFQDWNPSPLGLYVTVC